MRPAIKIKPQPWTEERIELLKGLWKEGRSCAQIARVIGGVSRCAVIGKIHRLKLSNVRPVNHRSVQPRAPRKETRDRLIQINKDTGEITDIRDMANEPQAVTLPDGSHIGVLEIGPRQCRWPHGEPRDLSSFHFCGHSVHEGSVYCRHHLARAFTPAPPRSQRKFEGVSKFQFKGREAA